MRVLTAEDRPGYLKLLLLGTLPNTPGGILSHGERAPEKRFPETRRPCHTRLRNEKDRRRALSRMGYERKIRGALRWESPAT